MFFLPHGENCFSCKIVNILGSVKTSYSRGPFVEKGYFTVGVVRKVKALAVCLLPSVTAEESTRGEILKEISRADTMQKEAGKGLLEEKPESQ